MHSRPASPSRGDDGRSTPHDAGQTLNVIDTHERAFAKVVSIIDASIAAQRPQQTANSQQDWPRQFWNEMLAIWTGIGGEETGTAAADFLIAVSKPVFDRVRAIGGHKTTASMPQHPRGGGRVAAAARQGPAGSDPVSNLKWHLLTLRSRRDAAETFV